MFFQIARENILLLINNIHEKMIKNRMFRRHLRTKLRHFSIISSIISILSQSIYLPCIKIVKFAYNFQFKVQRNSEKR